MKKSQKKALAIGGSLAALAAAAAGVYMMTGKNAKNRKKVAAWGEKMRKDVIKELHRAEKNSQATYNQVVDTVAKQYKGLKNVSGPELAATTAELKKSWDLIKSELENAGKTVRKIVPKAKKSVARAVKVTKKAMTKKAIKKAVKKAAKKR